MTKKVKFKMLYAQCSSNKYVINRMKLCLLLNYSKLYHVKKNILHHVCLIACNPYHNTIHANRVTMNYISVYLVLCAHPASAQTFKPWSLTNCHANIKNTTQVKVKTHFKHFAVISLILPSKVFLLKVKSPGCILSLKPNLFLCPQEH